MRFLLLNQTFHPDVVASAQLLSDLARSLVARGHQVTVLAARRSYDAPQNRFPPRETWHGIQILRLPSTGLGKNSRWSRAVDFASFLASCLWRFPRLPRFDVVIALTSPPLVSFLGACLAWFHRGRFIYWVMDLNPDEAVAAGWLKPRSLSTRFLERLSRFTLSRADKVIALDHFMRRRILTKGLPPERVAVIPPWSHDEEVRFDPAGRQSFRHDHGWHDKFVVMHSGNHSPCHPLDTLLQGAARLAQDPSIIFCFCGGGSQWRSLQERYLPPNVLLLPYQPLASLSALLSAADLHVVLMGNPFVGLVHPSKIYNLLRIASPILYLGPEPSPISEILKDPAMEASAACARHGDVLKVVSHIQTLRRAPPHPRPLDPLPFANRFSRATLLPQLIAEIEAGTKNCRRPNPVPQLAQV